MLGDLATKLATGATDDASLLRAVKAAGGIERVVSLAKGHLDSLAVQVQYAASVRDCCLCEELALDMGNAGGIETLIKAAQKHYDSPEVQSDAPTDCNSHRLLIATDCNSHRLLIATDCNSHRLLVTGAGQHRGRDAQLE